MISRRRSRGYTLVEVLVAFMIMALALTVILRIFATGMRNVSVASDYAQAVLIAEARLETAGIDDTLAPGRTDGVEAGRFRWTRVVTDYEPSLDYRPTVKGMHAYHVAVTVAWPNGDGERRIDVGTVKLRQDGQGT